MARATHRDQSREGAWAARYGCTAIAFLVAMDQSTAGRIGPLVDVDDFRARQDDQEGGLDLRDGATAARTYGVRFNVYAAYGAVANPATYDGLVEFGRVGRALVIQGDHDRLPAELRCDDFLGDHAVMSRGWRQTARGRVWDVSNPLCDGWSIWPDDVMRAYTGKLAGEGRAWFAAGPLPQPEEEPAVLPVTDRTPMLVELEVGDQLFTLAGVPKVKVSVAGRASSPFGAAGGRVVIVKTAGVVQAVLAKPAPDAIVDIVDPDDAVLAQIRDLAGAAIDDAD